MLLFVSRRSPSLEGFRAAFRRPSVTFAEIAWRWSVGGTAVFLFAFGVVEYLDSLPVTNWDVLFLRTRNPILVAQALAHILRGSLSPAIFAGLITMIALGAMWIVASSIGRAATVRSLLDYFSREEVASDVSDGDAPNAGGRRITGGISNIRRLLAALIELNFFRAAIALAAFLAVFGAAILAGQASPWDDPQPGLVLLLFMALAWMVWLVWWSLNWLLSLATIFAVRDGDDAFGALSAAVTFCRQRAGRIFAVSTWTGIAHVAAFMAGSVGVLFLLGLLRAIPPRIVALSVALAALAYFAVTDWLSMARLAGYVFIAETPDTAPEPSGSAPMPEPPAIQTSIDRNEPILSDAPIPSVNG